MRVIYRYRCGMFHLVQAPPPLAGRHLPASRDADAALPRLGRSTPTEDSLPVSSWRSCGACRSRARSRSLLPPPRRGGRSDPPENALARVTSMAVLATTFRSDTGSRQTFRLAPCALLSIPRPYSAPCRRVRGGMRVPPHRFRTSSRDLISKKWSVSATQILCTRRPRSPASPS